jgi:uncharacterized protein
VGVRSNAPNSPPPALSAGGSLWRTGPGTLARLLLGLTLFGAGEGLVVASELGNSPWTVFAEGVSVQTPLSIGLATLATSALVLLAWIPLRQRPGLGTVLNAIVIGLVIDLTLFALPALEALGVRWLSLAGGIALVGVGSGFYLNAALGPGPRDGLMVGLHLRFGWPVAMVRTGIEATAVAAGFLLGGTVGAGSLLFALLIGPAVATSIRVLRPPSPAAASA